ncbi:hypothetical protein [Bradyrhizobium macuxiense]|nr:hypothetical protein [Bradyrhizobium macuxiense]
MVEATDQASDTPALPNAQPALKKDDKPIPSKQETAAAEAKASWGEVLNAMHAAEDAVSKAVQGMADSQKQSISDNLK